MVNFDYIISVLYSSNYDYTGYESLIEVIDDFKDYISREMWESSAMEFLTINNNVFSTAKFSRLEYAINELDFLQECMDAFSNYSLSDLYADVIITQVNTETGEPVTLLNVHIKQNK